MQDSVAQNGIFLLTEIKFVYKKLFITLQKLSAIWRV